jgi:CRP-like cAMP-binding protein
MPGLNAQLDTIPESERYGQLKALRFFENFAETELWEATRIGAMHRVTAGEVIFREGSPGASVYVLCSGKLDVTRKGVKLGIISAGDCFGELAFVEAPHHIRSATVTAAADATFAEFDAEAVAVASAGMQAALSKAIMRALVERLHHADARYLSKVLQK